MFELFVSHLQLAQEVLQFLMGVVVDSLPAASQSQDQVEMTQLLLSQLDQWIQADAISVTTPESLDPEVAKQILEELARTSPQFLHY